MSVFCQDWEAERAGPQPGLEGKHASRGRELRILAVGGPTSTSSPLLELDTPIAHLHKPTYGNRILKT